MLATKRRHLQERTPEQYERYNDFCELGRVRVALRPLRRALFLTAVQQALRVALLEREAELEARMGEGER